MGGTEPTVRVLTERPMRSGESPVWDVAAGRLWWIDNAEHLVHSCAADGGALASWDPERLVTAVAPCALGGVILASGRRLVHLDPATGEVRELAALPPGGTPFNDAKVDRSGRFVVGTVDGRLFGPHAGAVAEDDLRGGLVRLDEDLELGPVADGIGISNGPCFSIEGSKLFCSDSWTRRIHAYDYDAGSGAASNRRVFAQFDDDARPDGATVDAEDHLWVADYDGGAVRRYDPDGGLDRSIAVPVSHPSSVMFGGTELEILYVTSSVHDAAGDTGSNPLDGHVLAIDDLGVHGVPERPFAGAIR